MNGFIYGRVLFALCCGVLLVSHAWANTEVLLVGKDISSQYFIGTNYIIQNSDSLYLNNKLLSRGIDYFFNEKRGAFVLNNIISNDTDTLKVKYQELPQWLKTSYGRPFPETNISETATDILTLPTSKNTPYKDFSEVRISGVKTFRVTTQNAGGSNFNQSLDLKLSGQLTKDLEISGAISDRGYDPSYGTSNSRLNELDKINMALKSPHFYSQFGDMVLKKKMSYGINDYKKMSGASFDFNYPLWSIQGVAARPRGTYNNYEFYGIDNKQGPYQIGKTYPIVPGSETIWLNGKKLERGANKDYIMDYPAGMVVFNVNYPIDKLSRIEIDYEQVVSEFKSELFTTGGSVNLPDSSLVLEVVWLREGDDKNNLQIESLSDSDKSLISLAGDNIESAVRTGVMEDSLGAYILVTDSLPDSVYQYVGDSLGDYEITFTYKGNSKGNYIFLGDKKYQFVGDGNGDYKPVVDLPIPKRVDVYSTKITYKNDISGVLQGDFRQSSYDRNLLSKFDDNDNNGIFFSAISLKEWMRYDKKDFIRFAFRKKDKEYISQERLYEADFNRKFLIPDSYSKNDDELLYDISCLINPIEKLSLQSAWSKLNYKNYLKSDAGGIEMSIKPLSPLTVRNSWRTIKTVIDSLNQTKKGDADIFESQLDIQLYQQLTLRTVYEFDKRTNNYNDEKQGTKYQRGSIRLNHSQENISYEYYNEDTLSGDWQQTLERNRISFLSERKIGKINYYALATLQNLKQNNSAKNSFLSRISVQYNDFKNKFNWGASYALSHETRNNRGINYLEVNRGEGNFIMEDGNYIPDPDGNYIKVEEILSEQAEVKKGEKSFNFDKSWDITLIKFNSYIDEELLEESSRNLWWLIPFWSDLNKRYQYYNRRYDVDYRIFPIQGSYIINIKLNEDREIRTISGLEYVKKDYRGELTLKEIYRQLFFEQQGLYFKNTRDVYYSGSGDIEGYKFVLKIRHLFNSNEMSLATSYRRADAQPQTRSIIYAIGADTRFQVIKKGELRTSLELYRQKIDNPVLNTSYLLTDNHPGDKGAIWTVSIRYGVKKGMRINLSLNGRNADNRTARLTGRGEFIADF